jgi:hypothetical protein
LRATLNSIQDYPAVPDYFLTDRDKSIQAIESFDSVLADWKRRSKPGNIKHTYEVREVADFEPGEPKFRPEPGGLYFYENVGTSGSFRPGGAPPPNSTQVVVGDAKTKEVIASYELPEELRGSVHTTVMSPDGRYVYIIGFPRRHTTFSDHATVVVKGRCLDVAAGQATNDRRTIAPRTDLPGQISDTRQLFEG